MANRTFVIAIAGASGSGKSRLARELNALLNSTTDVAVLNEDAYYHQQSDLTAEQRENINYDHPDAIDEALLVRQLAALKAGQSVNVPVYDYATHDRSPEIVKLGPCELLIVEGILLLHRSAVREIADLTVFVDVPEEVCLERRIKRDIATRGRTRESVLAQYEQTVGPMFRKFVAPSKQHADIVVQNADDGKIPVEQLLIEIRKRNANA